MDQPELCKRRLFDESTVKECSASGSIPWLLRSLISSLFFGQGRELKPKNKTTAEHGTLERKPWLIAFRKKMEKDTEPGFGVALLTCSIKSAQGSQAKGFRAPPRALLN